VTVQSGDIKRCKWAQSDPLMREYHDREWGVPEFDSRALWELLMLEGFQAGLSWIVVLRKREAFRRAFAEFDPAVVARFGEADVARLMADAGIVRARAKIEATIRGGADLSRDAGEWDGVRDVGVGAGGWEADPRIRERCRRRRRYRRRSPKS
jgi:DNA-3-methyladenine glycosylase I